MQRWLKTFWINLQQNDILALKKRFGKTSKRLSLKWLRGLDLNQRPLGYERMETPVLFIYSLL